jgi:hypothetical protein
MARKEHFFYRETKPLLEKLELLARRSGISRGQAFEDWLTAMVCALAAETKEEEYLAVIERHKKGKKGQRGADLMGELFGQLVDAMTRSNSDILGDLYEGAITYGENGQYFSPETVATFLAKLTVDPDEKANDGQTTHVNDPACGTGRMLLAAADINPNVELVGVDIDSRCARITAVNLGLRSRYGWVVCGNTLSGEMQFAYRIGHFYHEGPNGRRRGVIRDVALEATPIIASRIRRESTDLFVQSNEPKSEGEPTVQTDLPTIFEVPQWLARLEPQFAAPESPEPVSTAELRDDLSGETSPQSDKDPLNRPGEQGRLFD